MAQGQGRDNIRTYRKPLNINLGMMIFLAIFIYIIICVVMSLNQKKIVPYEVKIGSLSTDNLYTGMAIRQETVINSEYAGYINYYAREGERVGCYNLVCTVDETGQLKDMISEQNAENSALSDTDLREVKAGIINFRSGFQKQNFDRVYDIKYELEGTVLKLANINVLQNMEALNSTGNGIVNLCRSPQSGIISYFTDGFESVTPETVTQADFDRQYQKTNLIGNELVSPGDPIYKLSTNENWSVIIPVTRTKAAELEEAEYVKVKFLKDQNESWGEVRIWDKGADGVFAQLSFTNSMISFVNERFLDIELIMERQSGLKVPKSAITTKEFFLVEKEYVTKGGNAGGYGVLRETAGENGLLTTEFVATQIYHETDTDYYLDNSALRVGDHIVKPESAETYTISRSATLKGVYNINKGYADFKEIQILYDDNEEYAIIKSNTTYGLSEYDHIVLDAQSVDLNEFIYE